MVDFLNGSRHMTAVKETVYKQLEESAATVPALQNTSDYEDGLESKRRVTLERVRAMYRMFMADHGDADYRAARVEIATLYDPHWATRNGVHFGLFCSALQSQGSEEQVAEWLPQAYALTVYGCFGMTELGHGSFVRGIETTATFIPGTGADGEGEWEIHSPTVTSTKWWIGAAGETATHCTLYARLISKGVDHGVHCFIIQIRDPDSHQPLPGIRLGDIGPKMGRNGVDNGWMQFHHARFPRSALLCRLATVDRDGQYHRAPRAKPQMAYGALIMGRASMVSDSAAALQLATTIAVRWAALRRQGAPMAKGAGSTSALKVTSTAAAVPKGAGPASPTAVAFKGVAGPSPKHGKGIAEIYPGTSSSASAVKATAAAGAVAASSPPPEPQLLDYVTVQARLMPLVATAFAFSFTAARMRAMYDSLMAGMDNEDTSSLPDVHATSSGLKAFCTWATHNGIESCRQSMGGHGYSAYSRLPMLGQDFAVMCTWEGDNTVMALQTSRYLISSLAKAKNGEQLAGSVRYLTERLPPRCDATRPEHLLDPNSYLQAMRWRARSAVIACDNQLEACKRGQAPTGLLSRMLGASTSAGQPPMSDAEAWNACSAQLVLASRAHVYYNISYFFAYALAKRRADEEDVLGAQYGDSRWIDPLTGRHVSSTTASAVPARAGRGSASTSSSPGGARDASSTAASRQADAPESPIYPILKALCDLFALKSIQEDLAAYLRGGYFSAQHAAWIDEHVTALCARVRADAVPLVDSFGISDFVLNSPLGRYDGDVYRHYMAVVQQHGTGSAAGAEATAAELPLTAASGPPHLMASASSVSAAGIPLPYSYQPTPYFESSIRPMLEGADMAAGPIRKEAE